ncbi:MAG: histidine phosphatase family protein [Pseudomonadota bacterium]
MSIIWMIRHGQASFGTSNYDMLSELGARQARILGEWLAAHDVRPARILHGTLTRQEETAQALAEGLGGTPPDFEVHPGLNEHDADSIMHAWFRAGNPHPEPGDRKAHFRALTAAVLDWQAARIEANETFAAFEARVADAMDLAARGERPVFVVSSGGPIGQAVRAAVKAPAETQIRLQMQVKNASFTRFAGRPERLNLMSFNETPHLDPTPELVTWS